MSNQKELYPMIHLSIENKTKIRAWLRRHAEKEVYLLLVYPHAEMFYQVKESSERFPPKALPYYLRESAKTYFVGVNNSPQCYIEAENRNGDWHQETKAKLIARL